MRHLLFAVAFLIFLFSCGKPYENVPAGARYNQKCPAFEPKQISTWMPYELHKTYYYVDSNGLKYTLTVEGQRFSEEYIFPSYGSCVITGDIYTLADTADTLDINLEVGYGLHSEDPGGSHLYINWMGTLLYFDYSGYPADTLRPEQPTPNNSLSVMGKMSFGGKEYHTVHELTVNKNKLQKLYIAKGHGVVAFITADSTTYWLSE